MLFIFFFLLCRVSSNEARARSAPVCSSCLSTVLPTYLVADGRVSLVEQASEVDMQIKSNGNAVKRCKASIGGLHSCMLSSCVTRICLFGIKHSAGITNKKRDTWEHDDSWQHTFTEYMMRGYHTYIYKACIVLTSWIHSLTGLCSDDLRSFSWIRCVRVESLLHKEKRRPKRLEEYDLQLELVKCRFGWRPQDLQDLNSVGCGAFFLECRDLHLQKRRIHR